MPAVFRQFVGASFAKCFYCDIIFLNQLIQFYSNNATNLYQLTSYSTTVLPHKMEIVLRPQIVTLLHPMYS